MRTRDTITRAGRTVGGCALAGLALVALPACRGDRSNDPPRQFFPDLDDQMKWHPQGQSTFFADGRTMRHPPVGTVAFGRQPFVTDAPWGASFMKDRTDLLKEDGRFYKGVNPDGTYLETIPVPVTAAMLARGRDRFNIYCFVCHGYAGDGKGMVGVQLNPVSANFHEAKYKRPDPNDPKVELWKDGYVFHTIRNGVLQTGQVIRTMPSYAHAVDENDAWAIVAYVRVLQESRSGTLQDVPEQERPALENGRAALIEAMPVLTPPPAAPPAAAPQPAKPPAGGTP